MLSIWIAGGPGPATVLTEEEEKKLGEYVVKMADMGFGLTREDFSANHCLLKVRKTPPIS